MSNTSTGGAARLGVSDDWRGLPHPGPASARIRGFALAKALEPKSVAVISVEP